MNLRYRCAGVALVLAVGCSKGDDGKSNTQPPPPQAGSSVATAGGAAAIATPTEAAAGKKLFTYPPAGKGPHEGFDFDALREQLQGAWMVGGSAFGTIPQIWYVRGDELTKVDPKGNRSEHTIELLAPCYAKVADVGASSATYQHFVFDGDTLYQGLGNAGVVVGDKSVGCMSAAVYVLEGETCTAWVKKSFPRQGESIWEPEPGECGYDGTTFFGDDTNAKRKIYGKQTLPVRVGDALMTKQMEGNKAEKMPSFDAALAKQQELIAAHAAATATPTEFPFSSWELPAKEITLEKGARAWAAATDRKGAWRIAGYRFDKTEDSGVLAFRGMSDCWAPSAFVRPAATTIAKGTPVVVVTGTELYGLVTKVAGDQVTMAYWSASKLAEKTEKLESFLPMEKGAFALGTPVLVKDGESLAAGRAVFDAGDTVYVMNGSDNSVAPISKANLTAIDGHTKFKVGSKVLVRQTSGIGGLKWLPGKVTKVHGGGAAYDVTTDDGKKYTQTWAYVTAG